MPILFYYYADAYADEYTHIPCLYAAYAAAMRAAKMRAVAKMPGVYAAAGCCYASDIYMVIGMLHMLRQRHDARCRHILCRAMLLLTCCC